MSISGPRPAVTTARDVLHGRLLIQLSANDALLGFLDQLPAEISGAVITGKPDYVLLDKLHRRYPDLLLATEPDVDRHTLATADRPFVLGEADLFGEQTLDRFATEQREAGASFAILPTGRIQVGNDASLKATINVANELDREDIVVRVPCEWAWLKSHSVRQLAAVLGRSRHPVALSLAHEKDPMEERGVVEAVRSLTASLPLLMLWRADLSAVPHIAEGGLAGAIGLRPSQRHGLLPDAFAINKADRRPRVIVREWLRYVRVLFIEQLYATAPAPRCNCAVCGGRPLDRFSGTDADQAEGHAHNVEVLVTLHRELSQLKTPEERRTWWREQVRSALQAHDAASRLLRREVAPHAALAAWGCELGIEI